MVGVGEFVAQKKLRLLAVTTAKRHADYPSTPTMTESGYPGFEDYVSPVGFMVPAGTSPAVIAKLDSAIRASIAKPATQERLRRLGGVVVSLGAGEYGTWQTKDRERWARLIKDANVKAED